MSKLDSIEICAGAGGQALGLEKAGFNHIALVEIEPPACATLRLNRPDWHVVEQDIKQFSALFFKDIDLLAGGVPCPPFSKAGKQLGEQDDRDLFPEALRLAEECRPKAIMLENVRGLLDKAFDDYRAQIEDSLSALGYKGEWRLLHASDYGVSQLRPRVIFVAMQERYWKHFSWPKPNEEKPPPVGELLVDLMASNGWPDAEAWAKRANAIAPTLVGGSKKHGGPDLGPTRAKQAWLKLDVDGKGLWNEAPDDSFTGTPRLTPRMTARVQGFPDEWLFHGKKTAVYRQIGNAFPPPVAEAVGKQIHMAITAAQRKNKKKAASNQLTEMASIA